MGSADEIMQMCRLCLVKDQVNIPIFDEPTDIKQTFLKISSCLPVKVSREDNLPKKICDDCSYKLDVAYQFRNTSSSSEKQLIQLLEQFGIPPFAPESRKSEISVKLENVITEDGNICPDTQNYILQQQKLPYQQSFAEFGEASSSDAPPRKRAKRASATSKKSATATSVQEILTDPLVDSSPAATITKAEEDSNDSDDMVLSTFASASATSANDQAGPSGVGKGNIDAPSKRMIIKRPTQKFECDVCLEKFARKVDFVQHHFYQYGSTFNCCKCGLKFKTTADLYAHFETHKGDKSFEEVVEEKEMEEEEVEEDEHLVEVEVETEEEIGETVEDQEIVEEIVLNYEDEEDVMEVTTTDNSELLYILDDSQCVNEVVIEEDVETESQEKEMSKPMDSVRIVRLEHGYMIPDDALNGKQRILAKVQASTSKLPASQSRPRALPPKRRHVVPDFSSTNYMFINANEEVDIPHYKCLRCEQLFINKFVFFRHIEKGKCYINNCDVCNATFTKNSEFYYHYVMEHTDRAICNFCFRTFMYEKNVKEHMLRHLDQFRHRCDECNKGFYTVREYRNHYKNRHMGIRHVCRVCSRSFADEYYFRRHLATHEQAGAVIPPEVNVSE